MILRIFFLVVIVPSVFVNRKIELKDNSTKKMTAKILWSAPLTLAGSIKVPTKGAIDVAHGNKHIPKPAIPAQVKIISSNLL